MRQLSDSEVYIPLPDDPTVEIIEKINGRVLGVLLYLGAILRQKGYPTISFVDHQWKLLAPQIPCYVKDTIDFSQTQKKGTFPDGAILVTIEVAGLYTHIPHDEGLAEKL